MPLRHCLIVYGPKQWATPKDAEKQTPRIVRRPSAALSWPGPKLTARSVESRLPVHLCTRLNQGHIREYDRLHGSKVVLKRAMPHDADLAAVPCVVGSLQQAPRVLENSIRKKNLDFPIVVNLPPRSHHFARIVDLLRDWQLIRTSIQQSLPSWTGFSSSSANSEMHESAPYVGASLSLSTKALASALALKLKKTGILWAL